MIYDLRFVPALLAAVDRHDEAENWATWGNVVLAAKAVRGDGHAQECLLDPAWQLTEDGRLP